MKINLIYGIGFLVLLFLFFLSYSKYKMEEQTIADGKMVNVLITNINCSQNKSYIVCSYNNSNHIANIDYNSCRSYKIGDSILLLFNNKYELFFSKNLNTNNEKWGMILSGALFIIAILSIVFPRINFLK